MVVKAWAASEAREKAESVEAQTEAALSTFWRDDEGELHDSRTAGELEDMPPPQIKAENDALEAEVAAIKNENEAVKEARNARREAAPILTHLLADGFRLRITIGADSPIVPQHMALCEVINAWRDSVAPDEQGKYQLTGDPEDGAAQVREALDGFVEACQHWSAEH